MPYRILTNGVIECDTPDEVHALAIRPQASKPAKRRGGPNLAVKKMWAAAKALAKREGISVGEARTKLSKRKAK